MDRQTYRQIGSEGYIQKARQIDRRTGYQKQTGKQRETTECYRDRDRMDCVVQSNFKFYLIILYM